MVQSRMPHSRRELSVSDRASPESTALSALSRSGSEPRWKVYLGCFLTFGVMGVLLDICMVQQRPWYGVMIMSCMMGLIAVGWAYSCNGHEKLLFVVIPASIIVPVIVDYLLPSQAISVAIRRGLNPRLFLEVIICTAMFAAGYALTGLYIRGEASRHQRLRTELALAQRIHETLVPPIVQTMRQVELYGRSDAGSEMGGDLLDVHEADGAVTLFLADVSGHGVAAGVMMGMVKSAIRMRLRSGADLSALLNDLNEVVCELTRPGMFVTFSCLRFDGTNRVQYSLAGHLPILCVRRGARAVQKLPNDSLPLGVMPEEKFAANTAECGPGDLFVLLTDGLTETMNKSGQLFGDDRIDSILVANADRPLAEIHSALLNAVRGHGPQGDDQTIFLARVRT